MSLKAFHVVFIAVCGLFLAGFAGWCFLDFASERDFSSLAMGVISAACGVGLVPYSRWFLRKLKNVGYL